ncbi:GNAT family N-acetyltransferase [Oleisolibacter albus]|uniref:GNAT family N-acetyltransferase n=1 Tax=Oleisolibacter albus TaxID=2171757 RepID=UPI000DF45A54|nr:GNAT family N-acetyltransferase [Oleisolibacter albus]
MTRAPAPAAVLAVPAALDGLAAYAAFTYPRYRPLLGPGTVPDHTLPQADACFAVTAADGQGRPLGLALAARTAPREGRLLSILVAAPWRRQGLGRRLLAAIETAAAHRGLDLLTAYYNDGLKGRPALEALLAAAAWSPPQTHEVRLFGRASFPARAEPDWRPFLRRVEAQGYSHSLYAERTPADEAAVQALCASDRVEPRLRPADWLVRPADPRVSILIRRHGAVAGWVLGEPGQDFDGIHYTLGYVLPSLRRAGWLIRGLWEVVRLQAAAYGPDHLAVYETNGENTPMIRVMLERLSPYAERIDAQRVSRKPLAP